MPFPKRWPGYLIAVFSTVAVATGRYVFDRAIGGPTHFLLPFVVPVMLAAWYGGGRAGVFATALNGAVIVSLFVGPEHGLNVNSPADQVRVGVFVGVGAFMSIVCEQFHRFRERVDASTRQAARRHRELEAEVAERQAAERRLLASQALLRLVTDQVPVMLVHCDRDQRYTFVNKTYADRFGLTPKDVVGKTVAEVVGPQVYDRLRGHIAAALAGETVEFKTDIPSTELGVRTVHCTYRPEVDRAGRVRGFVATILDVTAQDRVDQALRESDGRYRMLLEGVPQLVWTCRSDGRCDYLSRQWVEYTGVPEVDQLGDGWANAVHPDDRPALLERWRQAVETDGAYDAEFRIRAGSGGYRWFKSRAVRLDHSGGKWFGASTDIDDKKRAEDALRELNRTLELRVAERAAEIDGQRRLLDAILDALPVAVVLADPTGRLTRFNRACEQVWGVAPLSGGIDEYREWVGYWPDTGRRIEPHEWAMSRALLRGEQCPGELLVFERFGDRSRRLILNSAAPVRGADGAIVAGVVASIDVTDRAAAEAALRESEERFRLAVEATGMGVWDSPLPATTLGWDARLKAIWGLPADARVTFPAVLGMVHPDDRVQVELRNTLADAPEGDGRVTVEHRIRTPAGEERWVSAWGRTVFAQIGPRRVPVRSIGVMLDVTDRRRAVEALRLGEERFRTAFDAAPIGMALVGPEGRWLRVNRSLCEIVGYAEGELLATDIQAVTHPDDRAADRRPVRQMLDGTRQTYQAEKRYLHKAGHVVDVLLSASLVRDGAGAPLYFIAQIEDITRRKAAEHALRDGEERFRLLIEGVKDYALFMLDPAGRVVSWNTGAERITGYRAEEIVGQSFARFYLPDDLARDHPGDELRVALADGRYEEEGQRVRKDGAVYWAAVTLTAVHDQTGRHVGFAKVTRNISDRRAAEAHVRTSLREKEVLLKEIHHRVKNNLQIVSALLDLQAEHTTDPGVLRMFKESRGRVKSMALIHERLYRSQDMARVNFVEYVRQLADDLYRTYKVSDDDIRLELDVDVPPLPIDIAIPCGLLLNELMSNCLKHAFKDADEGCIRVSIFPAAGDTTVMAVADDGAGFPAGTDFRATTSFGMQLVNTLVDQLGGDIDLTTDRGTTFTVRFPNPVP